MKSQENPIYNLGFNIVLPVLILNKWQVFFPSERASLHALILALLLPCAYGLKDFYFKKKINIMSLIGVLSIALTGGLALFQFKGIYFAIKEALIPLILAIVAAGSIFFKKPLASFFILKSSIFNKQDIKIKLQEHNKQQDFQKLMNISTLILAASLVLSSILNFVIAILVFKDIDPHAEQHIKQLVLNKQVADMTWMGYVFIALPLSIVTAGLFYWIIKRLKSLTGMSLEELIPSVKTT